MRNPLCKLRSRQPRVAFGSVGQAVGEAKRTERTERIERIEPTGRSSARQARGVLRANCVAGPQRARPRSPRASIGKPGDDSGP
jgi:hypothetical protein